MGQGEDQMEVGHRQGSSAQRASSQRSFASVWHFGQWRLAAGMVTGHFCAAVITGLQMATEGRRTAVLDGLHHAALLGAERMGSVYTFPGISRRSPPTGKVRPQPQRILADDFLAAVFPDQPASRTSPAHANIRTTPWSSRPCATASARPWTSRGWNASSVRSRERDAGHRP